MNTPTEPSSPSERSALAWIVRPNDSFERRGAVILWWVLAGLFCGPQHFPALPFFPLGLAVMFGYAGWLLESIGLGHPFRWVGSMFNGFIVGDWTACFALWGFYLVLTVALLVLSARGGRLWRVLAWTLVILLILNTVGCDIMWIDEAIMDD